MRKINRKDICGYCKKEFSLNSNAQRYCMKCRPIVKKRLQKIYHQKNKEKEKKNWKIWKEKNPKIWKENWKKWYLKNKERIRDKRKREDIKEMRRKDSLNYRKKYPEKIKAIQKTQYIKIPNGTMCQRCNKNLAKHKHHPNYSQPNKIKFLCIECHTNIHHKDGGKFFGTIRGD